ncbi:tRNA(His) guanylyltransferase 2-like isoform X2 [Wolffia australiana]
MLTSKLEYVREFESGNKLPNFNWIVVRIDGWHFHKFAEAHRFEKPNDARALNLMNACAACMLENFPDILFAYGDSDEYSQILSQSVSLFTSAYVMKWKEFFPTQDLIYPPAFDGRVICYPKIKLVRDYLNWRQADCHINNQFNTCFWALVKSGKSKSQAQKFLQGTQTAEKNRLLKEFGIDYGDLPAMFRKGSCVYEDKSSAEIDEQKDPKCRNVVIDHSDIIGNEFWNQHSYILSDD